MDVTTKIQSDHNLTVRHSMLTAFVIKMGSPPAAAAAATGIVAVVSAPAAAAAAEFSARVPAGAAALYALSC